MKKILALIFSMSFLLLPAVSSAISLNLEYPTFGGIDLNCQDPEAICGQELNTLIAWFYYFIVGIAGLAVFVMLVWGGFQYLSSAGNPAAIGDAKDKIKSALLGLLTILGSWLILQVINPELTILKLPELLQASETTPECDVIAKCADYVPYGQLACEENSCKLLVSCQWIPATYGFGVGTAAQCKPQGVECQAVKVCADYTPYKETVCTDNPCKINQGFTSYSSGACKWSGYPSFACQAKEVECQAVKVCADYLKYYGDSGPQAACGGNPCGLDPKCEYVPATYGFGTGTPEQCLFSAAQ